MKYTLEDCEKVYSYYPRKIGKAKGQERLLKKLNNGELSLKEAITATRSFAQECIKHGTQSKYIPHWSTFVGQQITDRVGYLDIEETAEKALKELFKAWRTQNKKVLKEHGVNYE